MALTPQSVGPNPYIPGSWAEAFVPDQLIAGRHQLVTQPIVLAAGTRKRGSVLGRQTNDSFAAVAGLNVSGAANTGNSTIGTISLGTGYQFGTYVITYTDATHFTVTSPEGVVSGTTGTNGAAYNGPIRFTMTTGGTPMAAGDTFNFNVYQATGNYILSLAGASDGSQIPSAILVDDADASLGPVAAGAYLAGEFNANALIYDTSWTIGALRTALQAFSIYVKSAVTAADPVAAT